MIAANERHEYEQKRDKAIPNSGKACSIIIDSTNQYLFGLLHFITNIQLEKERSIKVKLVGSLEHCKPDILLFLTVTEEQETDANLVLKVFC